MMDKTDVFPYWTQRVFSMMVHDGQNRCFSKVDYARPSSHDGEHQCFLLWTKSVASTMDKTIFPYNIFSMLDQARLVHDGQNLCFFILN